VEFQQKHTRLTSGLKYRTKDSATMKRASTFPGTTLLTGAIILFTCAPVFASASDDSISLDQPAVMLLQSGSKSPADATEDESVKPSNSGVLEPLVFLENPVSIPEPSTIALIIGGFGVLMGFQRFRRRQ
jgi:hypothetical protein